ncbi:MAG: SDR family NAD(P)-dependent oxidoreductase [Dysgonamonadaceae bacterium]|jgi:NADP-dependent 3-hydroxy acid dehydrogenase YdfG|nr:SDR family NAD(P)-dependent oxidoreductase [Dysgonamonadaceae bacterium]
MTKIVLITGSTSGIGEACARKFASEGYNLILNGRKNPLLNSLAKDLIKTYKINVLPLAFDVRDQHKVSEILSSLPEEWRDIEILINNAGLVIGVDKEFNVNLEESDIVIDTNIKGLLTMTRCIVPGMLKRGKGHIINIGSVAGEAAYPGGSVYCATKAAVQLLSDGLRIDLVDTPLRVTNVKPGMAETHFSITRFRGDKAKADEVYKGLQPLTAKDISESVYFAASAPPHVQIADILILPTNQATGSIVHRE